MDDLFSETVRVLIELTSELDVSDFHLPSH